jgi:fructose-specific phosphotransferase system IIA component
MNLVQLVHEQSINLHLNGTTKEEIIDEMVQMLQQTGALSDAEAFKKAIYTREDQGHTGIGFSVAIPHGKSDAVLTPQVAFGRKQNGIPWDENGGEKAKLIFMIAVPEKQANNEHLKILQMLAVKLIDDPFRDQLLNAKTKEEALRLLTEV